MISIETIAELLMHKDATVAALAPKIGTIEDKGTDEYRVKPDDPAVLAFRWESRRGKDGSAAPSFVQFYYAPGHPTKLAAAVPSCTKWGKIAGNPGSSPYLYACRYAGSNDHLEVTLVATLTTDKKTPEANLKMLILQRSVW